MPSSKPERRFRDIIANIERIESHTRNLDRQGFLDSDLVMDAVERCLARISEAAVKLSELAEEAAPGPPWNDIRGYGNFLRHTYDGVAPEQTWEIVTGDLPPLKTACIKAIESLSRDSTA